MSNYVQIELGGELRGLKFNQGAHVEIQTKIEGNHNPIFASYAIIWGGLIGNCFVKQIEPTFTFEQVSEWADGISVDDANSILHAYKSSLPNVDDDKKKIHTEQKQVSKNTKKNALK